MVSKKRLLGFTWYLVIGLGLGITMLPIIWILVSSFRTNEVIWRYAFPFSFKTFLPTPFTLEAYRTILAAGFGRALLNSIFVTATTIVFGIFITSLSGFVFAKMHFPGKKALFVFVLLSSMIPFEALAIPLFVVIRNMSWLDSYQALIVPGVTHGICILLFRQFYLGIPQSYVDSAKVDGANFWQIYVKIFLPISKAAAISAGLFLFIFQWQAFLWPLIANPTQEYHVIQVFIARLSSDRAVYWNQQFAASIISTFIPVCILLILQKHFMTGIAGSGLKE